MMLPRREFLLFSALSVGSTMLDRRFIEEAFADMAFPESSRLGVDIVEYGSSSDSKLTGLAGKTVAPSGRYAQSLIYAIAPEALDSSLLLISDDDISCRSEQAEDAVVIDVGNEQGSGCSACAMAIEDADAANESASSMAFFDGTFEHLPDSIRSLGGLLGSDSFEDAACYMDEVVDAVLSRQLGLAATEKIRLYIASGNSGLEAETFNYLQENIFKYLNVECINNEVLASMGESEPDGALVVDLNRIVAANPHCILFKDASSEGILDGASSPLGVLWRKVPDVFGGRLLDIPKTEFSWLGAPLVSQGLGILWLGHVLWPDIFDVDIFSFAARYYELFVHCSISANDLPQSVASEGGLS